MLSATRGNARSLRSDRRSRPTRDTASRPDEARRAALVERRMRIAWALSHAAEDRRLVLALMLVERLTAAEAASALGVPVRRLRGFLRETLTDLLEAADGRHGRDRGRRTRAGLERYRKAS